MSPQTSFLLMWLAFTTPPAPHPPGFDLPQLPPAAVCDSMYRTATAEHQKLSDLLELIGGAYETPDDFSVTDHRSYYGGGWVAVQLEQARREAARVRLAWECAHLLTAHPAYYAGVRDGWAERLHHLIGERAMMLGELPLPLSLR